MVRKHPKESIEVRARLFIPVVIAAVAAAFLAASAPAEAASWYWTPGTCKSNLMKHGVKISDGRTFSVQHAYCIGKGGPSTCMWDDDYSQRLYRNFLVFVRSYDGAVRGFTMHPSGGTGWSGSSTRLFGHMSEAAFDSMTAPIAHQAASSAHELGCASPNWS